MFERKHGPQTTAVGFLTRYVNTKKSKSCSDPMDGWDGHTPNTSLHTGTSAGATRLLVPDPPALKHHTNVC